MKYSKKFLRLAFAVGVAISLGCGRKPQSNLKSKDALFPNSSLFHEQQEGQSARVERARGSHSSPGAGSSTGSSSTSGGGSGSTGTVSPITPVYRYSPGFDPNRLYSHYGYGGYTDKLLAYADRVKSEDNAAVTVGIFRFGPDYATRTRQTLDYVAPTCWSFEMRVPDPNSELVLDRVYRNPGGVGSVRRGSQSVPTDPRRIFVRRSANDRFRGGFAFHIRSLNSQMVCPLGYGQNDFDSFDSDGIGAFIREAFFYRPFCGPAHGRPTIEISNVTVSEASACNSGAVISETRFRPKDIYLPLVTNAQGIETFRVIDNGNHRLEMAGALVHFDGPGYLGESNWYWDRHFADSSPLPTPVYTAVLPSPITVCGFLGNRDAACPGAVDARALFQPNMPAGTPALHDSSLWDTPATLTKACQLAFGSTCPETVSYVKSASFYDDYYRSCSDNYTWYFNGTSFAWKNACLTNGMQWMDTSITCKCN